MSTEVKKKKLGRDHVRFVPGTVLAIDGQPVVLRRKREDESHLRYAFVLPDGTLGAEGHMAEWEMRAKLDRGEVQYIDGASARTVVDLPTEWRAQVAKLRAAADAALRERRSVTNEAEPVVHPSYGVVTLTRSSGHRRLFGSPFRHQHAISIDVYRAEATRSLSNDRASTAGLPCLLSLEMSEAQFARFITSTSIGEGTPCTIDAVFGSVMPPVPEENETEKFHADVQRTLADAGKGVERAVAAVTNGEIGAKLSKKDREALADLLREARRAFSSSIPFTVEQFGERMEHIVAQGKHEIEAFANATLQRAGMEALAAAGGPVKFLTQRDEKEQP